MAIFSSLSRQQKEAVGLLQIGTFLEYFDLLLYVHMAVLLNELFFPKTDPHTAAIISAFAFCSTYALRPFGALVFGWIGDNIGRKPTVVITTIMMAVSCIIMASLPTYAEIGISAAWIITICRLVQGLSSMGEIIGAEVYLTEVIPLPQRYPCVAFIRVINDLGSLSALGVAALVTIAGMNWRIAFWIGACIAVVGSIARARLRETPEFVGAKKRMKNAVENANRDGSLAAENLKNTDPRWQEKVNTQTIISCFLMYCGYPLCFFISFIFCANLLKTQFGYTAAQVIQQNLVVGLVAFASSFIFATLSQKIFPLKLIKIKCLITSFFSLCTPFLLNIIDSPLQLLMFQSFCIFFTLSIMPASAVILIHFPILKRFTMASLLFAVACAFVSIVSSFGIVYLVELMGNYGLYLITIPICIGYFYGVNHFEKLENQKHHQVHTPHPLSTNPNELKLTAMKS